MPFAQYSNSGASSRWGSSSPSDDPYSMERLTKQIDNANLRIKDAGFNVADADQRNAFEKFTNLPENQNWFLDTLELLGRGGNAVKNVIDKADTQDVGTSLYRGFSGQQKVSGADLAQKAGVESGFGKFLAGTAIDIATDPTSFIPAGLIAKGVGAAAKPVAGLAKAGYNAVEEAAPALRNLRETRLQPAMENFKDGLGHMFVPQYKWDQTLNGGTDDALKNLTNTTDNAIKYQTEESMRKIGQDASVVGLDNGADVGRIMENDLQINKNPDELLSDIIKGRDVKVNLAEGDLPDLLSKANQRILNSPVVAQRIAKKTEQLDQVAQRMTKLDNEFDIKDVSKRYEDGDVVSPKEEKALEKYQKYQGAQSLLKQDIENTKSGIQFNPLETVSQATKGEGFAVANPMPKLYKKALGNTSKFLDDISPKGSFDQVVKPEMADTLRPVVETLLKEGKATMPNIKGTPYEVELKRIFGDKISLLSKKDTTITLKQGNPNLKYYNLDGAKPVIPETLTDATKVTDGSRPLTMDDVTFNNRIDNVNIPRPARELSDSPLIHESAQRLMESNNDIKELAATNGIDIKEMSGYMTHILTEEARKAKRQTKVQGGNFGLGQPNKAILKNRKYDGSVDDINELHDKELFNPNAFFSTAIGQKRLIEYIHAESFKRQVLGNRSFATPFQKGMTVPDGAVVINPDQYKFFKVSTPDGSEFLGMGKGQEYVVTKGAKEALDRYQSMITDEGTKGFLKAFDTVQSFWKRFTLFSPGYHVRNLAGAMFNNSVGGMNVPSLAKYTTDAAKEVMDAVKGKESALFNEYRKQGLSSSGLSQVEFARAGQEPEEAIRKTVERMSKTGLDKVKDRVLHPFQTSQELGDIMDQTNRFALYKWAREKKGMSPEEAALKVKEVQFDYSKLTPFEKNVMVRVVPFYRWMKNNIPYQIKSFINDPRKYEWMNKARLNAQDAVGIDEKNMPDYMKESFAYPVYGEGGKGKMLGLNLPMGDLTKLSDPLKMAVDGLTPLIKTPIELSTNFNMFYKKPIQKFEGQQKQFQLGPLDFGIDAKTAYALEQATGQIGRGFSGYLQKPESQDQDNTFRMPTLGINSLLKPFDADKNARLEQLQKLKKLQEYMLYIQQQTGEKPRTVNQIRR